MDENLKRDIILDNYQNPFNKEDIDDNNYIEVNSRNISCIDDINLYIKIEDNIIKDAKFNGEACAISTSATSIMLKLIINKKLKDVDKLMTNFKAMIDEEKYDEDVLEEAIVFNEIYKQNNRKNCALLPWKGLEEAIKKYESSKDLTKINK